MYRRRLIATLAFMVTAVVGSQAGASSRDLHRRDLAPKILMVSPEQTGVLQTGGLAHATAGLATSLNIEGLPTEILMPYFLEMNNVQSQATGQVITVSLDYRNGVPYKSSAFSVIEAENTKNPTVFLRHITAGQNYFDNSSQGGYRNSYGPEATIGESYGAFAKAASEYILTNNYDVVILNDWTTGLIAVHLAEARKAGVRVPQVIFAIHNIAYQGIFPHSLSQFLGLDPAYFNAFHGYEFWGQMNFLKAGLQFSDMIYTVSKQYAKEIATPRFGSGLDGVIRQKVLEGRVTGILNGILDHDWDPTLKKPGLSHQFDSEDFSGKAAGKALLQAELGLPVSDSTPVFIMTSRLAEQKGFNYLLGAIAQTAETQDVQWIVIGNGDQAYADSLAELQRRFPTRVRYRPFSEMLEAKLTRYADFFVNGAWFEPSGLNQFFALKNGTIPVVSLAGGLADSVKPKKNGILFPITPGADGGNYDVEETRRSAIAAVMEAVRVYKDPDQLTALRRRGMSENNSWAGRIQSDFLKLFYQLAGPKGFSAPRACVAVHGVN